jgi:hypothetical protein
MSGGLDEISVQEAEEAKCIDDPGISTSSHRRSQHDGGCHSKDSLNKGFPVYVQSSVRLDPYAAYGVYLKEPGYLRQLDGTAHGH